MNPLSARVISTAESLAIADSVALPIGANRSRNGLNDSVEAFSRVLGYDADGHDFATLVAHLRSSNEPVPRSTIADDLGCWGLASGTCMP